MTVQILGRRTWGAPGVVAIEVGRCVARRVLVVGPELGVAKRGVHPGVAAVPGVGVAAEAIALGTPNRATVAEPKA